MESVFSDSHLAPLLAHSIEGMSMGFALAGDAIGGYCNAEGKRLLALPTGRELHNEWKNYFDLYSASGEVIPLERMPLHRALSGFKIRRERMEIRHKSGKRFQVAIDAFPLDAVKPRAAVVLIEDLAWEQAELTQRERWFGALGHEMRSALQSITIAATLLKRSNPKDELCTHLEAMTRNAAVLKRLVDDITDAAVMVDNAMDVRLKALPLREFVEKAVEASEFAQTQHRLKLQIADELRVWVDPDRLQQIVTNLLANARKYSSPGELHFGALERDDEVILFLKDQGPGIADEQQRVLFSRYSRLPSKREGTGLGLWICRELARRMGGDMWMRSRLGEGTTFYLSLHRERPPQSDAPSVH